MYRCLKEDSEALTGELTDMSMNNQVTRGNCKKCSVAYITCVFFLTSLILYEFF